MTNPAVVAREKPRHHWIVRATHWVNAVALTLMVGSGLRIFNAYPAFARKGESFCCWPWEGTEVPAWLTFGGWLSGARNWHFAMMWVLAATGVVYLAFLWLHGEWRDLVPPAALDRYDAKLRELCEPDLVDWLHGPDATAG